MYCKKCGKTIPDDSKYCPYCGTDNSVEAGSEILEPETPIVVEPKIKNRKRIIWLLLGAIVIAGISAAIIATNAKKEKEAKEEYMANMRLVSVAMLNGATEAESCGGLIHDVWYNSIMKKVYYTTDKYTRDRDGYGDFYNDYNIALNYLFSDKSFQARIEGIIVNQDEVDRLMFILRNPPKEYIEAYDAMKQCYDAYTDLVECVVHPTGDLSTFSDTFIAADLNMLKAYKSAKLYLDYLK